MARIADCKRCGMRFFDSTDNRINCNRCTSAIREKKSQLARLKRKWQGKRAAFDENGRTNFDTNWAVIQLIWREKLSVHECAEVLYLSESDVRTHIEIARQNAR